MSDAPLAEVSERAASGETARIYAALRAALGVPLVNLVFRHMATVPGCLPWAWACLQPLYAGAALHRAGAEIGALARRPGAVAMRRGIALDPGQVRATLDSYIRANPINMIALDLLTRACAAPVQGGDPPGPPAVVAPIVGILPMADLAALPPETVARLRALARQLHGADTPVIPSVFRHFAGDAAALDTVAAVMDAVTAGAALAADAAAMRAAGTRVAAGLAVRAPGPPDPACAATIRRLAVLFPENMARMTIVAAALRDALAGAARDG